MNISKTELPVESKSTSALIDPYVALTRTFVEITELLGIESDQLDIELVVKFGFDGGQTMESINFQNSIDQIDDKFFSLSTIAQFFRKAMEVSFGKILVQILSILLNCLSSISLKKTIGFHHNVLQNTKTFSVIFQVSGSKLASFQQ